MSERLNSLSKLMRLLRYGKQVITLGDEIAAVRTRLRTSVRLLEGSAEVKELEAKRTQLLRAMDEFPRLPKLRKYLFHVHGIAPGWEPLPPSHPYEPTPAIGVVCPACGRTVHISVELSMWDGSSTDDQSTSGIGGAEDHKSRCPKE